MEPIFLTTEDVVEIHADQLARYGGRSGLWNAGLLQSAVAMPESGFGEHYLHSDLFEMAAAYLFHIVQNHPFVDGNKRVGVASALVFLELNHVRVAMGNDALVEMVLAVAQGKMGKAGIAERLRKHVTRK